MVPKKSLAPAKKLVREGEIGRETSIGKSEEKQTLENTKFNNNRKKYLHILPQAMYKVSQRQVDKNNCFNQILSCGNDNDNTDFRKLRNSKQNFFFIVFLVSNLVIPKINEMWWFPDWDSKKTFMKSR